MKYKAVIFDLDGTLLDTIEDLGTAVNFALERRGFPLHSFADYRQKVGHGIRNLVTVSLPFEKQSDEAQMITVALGRRNRHVRDRVTLTVKCTFKPFEFGTPHPI